MDVALSEARRVALQVALDGERSDRERNQSGQFATPPALAEAIAKLALTYLGSTPIRLLEPSLGSGAFYSALLRVSPAGTIQSAVGVELDARFVRVAKELWSDTGLVVHRGDFTRKRPLQANTGKATLVLANPPYVRHHALAPAAKQRLKRLTEKMLGGKVSGLSGLHVFFLLLSHAWMADRGVAAWLLPSEWMDVNYGAAVRTYLSSQVTLLRVHRFDVADLQFDDALVSSSIIFFRKEAPVPLATCEFTTGSLLAPARVTSVPLASLRTTSKWGEVARHGETRHARPSRVPLSALFDVRRGIATGANDFFVRPRSEWQSLGVPRSVLRPILPPSRNLASGTIARTSGGDPDLPTKLALLDCRLPEDEVRSRFPKLWAYLASERGGEVRKGYLTGRRTPWYAQEQRGRAPFLATYMGRSRGGVPPFRFFWNRSEATATNSYLMLLPRAELAALFRDAPEEERIAFDFLCRADPLDLEGHGRVYGGGLHKLEPRELSRLDASWLATYLIPAFRC